jgi:hypothetical protein
MTRFLVATWAASVLQLTATAVLTAAEPGGATPNVAELIAVMKTVGREAQGNRAAQQAWRELAQADAGVLPDVLAALDAAEPLAANYIRSAIDAIAQRQLASGGKLPADALERFVLDRRHAPRGRRLAYELLTRADATAPDRLLPRMLDDPSVELRRDAVGRIIAEAHRLLAAKQSAAAAEAFKSALKNARDLDQIRLTTEQLAKLGQTVDLPRHFGFVMQWKLIGPFDNTDKKGLAVAYPPEGKYDPRATYTGKDGKTPLAWFDHATTDVYGMVDLNKAVGKHMGVAAYAAAEFDSDRARPVEIRLGCDTAYKVWLNGKLLSLSEAYHTVSDVDQYTARGTMKAGRNLILLKVCQNEQTEEWAQKWQFQLRVCDAAGTAVLSTNRPPTGVKRD